jgi:hypothetical protein
MECDIPTIKGWAFLVESFKPLYSMFGIKVYLFAVDTICKTVLAVELASFSGLKIDH